MRSRICFLVALFAAGGSPTFAQLTGATSPRRHVVTISYDWHYTQPLHFAEHPLGDLLGAEISSVQDGAYEYHTRDEATFVDVLEFSRRHQGATVTLYPFGMATGATLAVRGSIERLPAIRLAFDGPAPFPAYALTDARALDASAGVFIADRAPGWGLGSHAFVLGGIGRLSSGLSGGSRFFGEGGGGISVGPFGVDLVVKVARNTLREPVEHTFWTVPISVRGTLTF